MPSDPPLTSHTCAACGKRVSLRPDQFGRRMRCPKCHAAFVVPPPRAGRAAPPPADAEPAVEAGELVAPSPPAPPGFATARFPHPPGIVFDALVSAARRAGGEVRQLDRPNLRLGFAVGGEDHTGYVFPGPGGGAEVDLRPAGGGTTDRHLYGRIGAEILAYLDAHDDHLRASRRPALAVAEPLPIRTRRRRRDRDDAPVDALAICGFIASLVGLVLVCVPFAAVPAGLVGAGLSAFSLTQPRGQRGLAIAGLAVGTVAVILGGLVFLLALNLELTRRRMMGG